MKKLVFLIAAVIAAVSVNAQESKLTSSLGLATQHVHRGVTFNVAPVFEGKMQYGATEWLSVGTEATMGLNAVAGYGNNLNVFATASHDDLTLTVKDYYFLNGYTGGANNYFDYGKGTNHIVEASLKYTKEKYYGMAALPVYQATANTNKGLYLEAGYELLSNLTVCAGYVTEASAVNFRTKGGFTHVGLMNTRDWKVSESWTSVVTTGIYINPTYKHVTEAAGIGSLPVNATVSLTF